MFSNKFSIVISFLHFISALRIVKDLRSRLFRTMLNQEPGWYDTKGTGELINRLSNDTTLVGNSLSQNLSDGLRSIITIGAGTSMMVFTSPQVFNTIFSDCINFYKILCLPVIIGSRVCCAVYWWFSDSIWNICQTYNEITAG